MNTTVFLNFFHPGINVAKAAIAILKFGILQWDHSCATRQRSNCSLLVATYFLLIGKGHIYTPLPPRDILALHSMRGAIAHNPAELFTYLQTILLSSSSLATILRQSAPRQLVHRLEIYFVLPLY
jgi:hypothetical protein